MPVKMLKKSLLESKAMFFHPVSDFGSCLWLNTRAMTKRACVKFELFHPNRKQQRHEDSSSGQEAGPNTCTRVQARTSTPIALCHVLDARSDWSQNTADVRDASNQIGKTTPETVSRFQIKI